MTSARGGKPTTRSIEQLAVEVAELCSDLIGRPRWSDSWPCPRRYRADLRAVNDFRVLVEDMEDSESDVHGYTTFTTRHVKVFADDTLFVHAYKKVQGLDEHDGGGHADSRVDQVTDVWHVARAPYNDEGCARALRGFAEQLIG